MLSIRCWRCGSLSPLSPRCLIISVTHAHSNFSACVCSFVFSVCCALSLSLICSLASCPRSIVITHSRICLESTNFLANFCSHAFFLCSLYDALRCVRCVPHSATNHNFATFGGSSLNLLGEDVVDYMSLPL